MFDGGIWICGKSTVFVSIAWEMLTPVARMVG